MPIEQLEIDCIDNNTFIVNTTIVPDEEMFRHRPGHLVIASVIISLMIFVIWKVYRRHKSNMEPISLLQIHLLTELALGKLSKQAYKAYSRD